MNEFCNKIYYEISFFRRKIIKQCISREELLKETRFQLK
jgi:hypothetical protein